MEFPDIPPVGSLYNVMVTNSHYRYTWGNIRKLLVDYRYTWGNIRKLLVDYRYTWGNIRKLCVIFYET